MEEEEELVQLKPSVLKLLKIHFNNSQKIVRLAILFRLIHYFHQAHALFIRYFSIVHLGTTTP